MMYSQGLKRVIAARSTVAQLLIGSTNRALVAGLVNNNMRAFSLYNDAQVCEEQFVQQPIQKSNDILNYGLL